MNPSLLDPKFVMLAGVVVLVTAVVAWVLVQKRGRLAVTKSDLKSAGKDCCLGRWNSRPAITPAENPPSHEC